MKTYISLLLATLVLGIPQLNAAPIAIIGGQDQTGTSPPYAALVAPDGTLTQLSGGGLPSTHGFINGVAINSSGTGIIGGRDQTGAGPAYAALVASNGTLTQLSGGGFPSTNGLIISVAINNSGTGIIGGQDFFTGAHPAYAALVAPNGTLTQLSGGGFPSTSGFIQSVAINNSGAGIIGGQDDNGTQPAYAALVAPNGTLTQLSGGGFPSTHGSISSVAINSSGAGIIGGQDNTGTIPAYAALVAPNGTLTQLSGAGFPSTFGFIQGVAINNSGAGIIGGQDFFTGAQPAYAALVAPNGTLTQLSGGGFPSTNGLIISVAINNSGAGIIGGEDHPATNGPAYAALVAPNGTLTQLSGGGLPSVVGFIQSVAINNSGAGIIAGQDNTGGNPAYAALVAPNGTLTQLSGAGFPSIGGLISSVGIVNAAETILSAVTPQAVGPLSSVFNSQFIAVQALSQHISSQNSFSRGKEKKSEPEAGSKTVLVAAAKDSPVPTPAPLFEYKARSNYTVWFSPFGDYLRQSHRGSVPEFRNKVVGGLVAFDYHPSNYLVGGGLGYAHNFVHFAPHLGHGNLDQEMAFTYYSYYARNVWFNVTAWGGMYQYHGKRFAPFLPSTSSHIHGWILDPHGEVATPIEIKPDDALIVEPFAMVDWTNTWQDSFTERGRSGFNVHMKDHYSSFLRSEAGVRFYETLPYEWGKLVFEEKASYVNRAPFHNHTQVNFVASASTFPVATNLSHVQNLGAVEFRTLFLPENQGYPYGIIDAQVEAGSSFQSYFLSLEIGKNF